MPTDTPITDAREFEILSDLQSGTRKVVDAEVARKLERSNAAMRLRIYEILQIELPAALRKITG